MLLQDLKEFSQETSIHGLGQIADDAATKTKRFLWIIIFVGSLSYAGVMLHDAYHGGYTLSFYNNEPSKNKHFLTLLSSLARNSQEPKLKIIFEIP